MVPRKRLARNTFRSSSGLPLRARLCASDRTITASVSASVTRIAQLLKPNQSRVKASKQSKCGPVAAAFARRCHCRTKSFPTGLAFANNSNRTAIFLNPCATCTTHQRGNGALLMPAATRVVSGGAGAASRAPKAQGVPSYSLRQAAMFHYCSRRVESVANNHENAIHILAAAVYGLWAEATEAIQKYGAMVKSPTGFPMQSPYVAIANRQAEIMMRIASEFGFTPASRSRISTPSPEEPSLFDFMGTGSN